VRGAVCSAACANVLHEKGQETSAPGAVKYWGGNARTLRTSGCAF